MAYYTAEKCPCGSSTCKYWLVDPVASIQGVGFTEAQAKFIAAALNLARVNGEDMLTTEWMIQALKAMSETNRSSPWRPISTAPERRFVLVRGPSGMGMRKFITLAEYDPIHRPRDPWLDVMGDTLSDSGWRPEEWMEAPE